MGTKLISFLLLVFVFPVISLAGHTHSFRTEIVEKVKEATVFISISSLNNNSIEGNTGLCTGFIINDKGYIVTNYHCVHRATKLILAFYDEDDWNVYDVKIIGVDPVADLAVIHIPKRKKPLPYLNWSTEKLKDGTHVMAIGHPYGMLWSVSTGVISNTTRVIRSPYVRMIQSDVVLNQGNSGGRLVDSDGLVVGVNTMLFNPTPVKTYIGMSLSIRNDDAKMIVDELVQGKEFIRPILGLRLFDLTPTNRNSVLKLDDVKEKGIDIPNTFGTIVVPYPDLPEGIEGLDTIISVDGEAVNRQVDIVEQIRARHVGDKINLIIIRDKVFKNVTLTLKKLVVDPNVLYDKTPPQKPKTIPPKPKEENGAK